jgi:hypothetical protein
MKEAIAVLCVAVCCWRRRKVSGFNGKEADDKLELGDKTIRLEVYLYATRLEEETKTKPSEEVCKTTMDKESSEEQVRRRDPSNTSPCLCISHRAICSCPPYSTPCRMGLPLLAMSMRDSRRI